MRAAKRKRGHGTDATVSEVDALQAATRGDRQGIMIGPPRPPRSRRCLWAGCNVVATLENTLIRVVRGYGKPVTCCYREFCRVHYAADMKKRSEKPAGFWRKKLCSAINNTCIRMQLSRALAKKMVTLTVEDLAQMLIQQNNCCYYCRREIGAFSNSDCSASMDRLDSQNYFYNQANIVLACEVCQNAKNDFTVEQFEQFRTAIRQAPSLPQENAQQVRQRVEALRIKSRKKTGSTNSIFQQMSYRATDEEKQKRTDAKRARVKKTRRDIAMRSQLTANKSDLASNTSETKDNTPTLDEKNVLSPTDNAQTDSTTVQPKYMLGTFRCSSVTCQKIIDDRPRVICPACNGAVMYTCFCEKIVSSLHRSRHILGSAHSGPCAAFVKLSPVPYQRPFDKGLGAQFWLNLAVQQGGRDPYVDVIFTMPHSPMQPSPDRRDASKGYSSDNVQLVCLGIQYAKSGCNEDEQILRQWIDAFKNSPSVLTVTTNSTPQPMCVHATDNDSD